MYRGFKLPVVEFENISYWHDKGLKLFEAEKVKIRKTLDSYISPNGVLDGAQMESDWFPQVNAHIFISHSHGDEEMAIALSGWLFGNFGIKAFVDSCIWDYADDLLKAIDKVHCKNPNKADSYDYTLRNYSTSHVHMMLSTALSKMIDKTECLFFLNTPKSIMSAEIKTKTLSPWIYSEIAISKIIHKKTPERFKAKLIPRIETFSKGGLMKKLNESFMMSHLLDLSHFAEITQKTLNEWEKDTSKSPELALNKIYELVPALEKIKIQ